LARCKNTEYELLANWTSEVKAALAGGEGAIRMKGQLLEISRSGVLTVNYSSRLVQLLREVRQLDELGVTVSRDIKKAAEEGEKYYSFGVMLKRVANFFNSMDTQILKTQRPMLLNSLVAFEEIIEKHDSRRGMIQWSTPSECEHYVDRLQQAAAKLAYETRQLRGIHDTLALSAASLMDLDMLKHRGNWKQRWLEMKSQIEALAERYPVDRMRKWVLHWDCQVCKVLEVAFCTGLETLNESLQLPGSLQVELGSYSSLAYASLQFKPTLEEIRSVYYQELKKFVSVPSTFNGFNATNKEAPCSGSLFILPSTAHNHNTFLGI